MDGLECMGSAPKDAWERSSLEVHYLQSVFFGGTCGMPGKKKKTKNKRRVDGQKRGVVVSGV